MGENEKKLYACCYYAETKEEQQRAYEKAKILLEIPDLDVNWENSGCHNETALARISRAPSHQEIRITELLLAHPNIDVNKADKDGHTPFYDACGQGDVRALALLLADKRVDTKKTNKSGIPPFWVACADGKIEKVEYLLTHIDPDLNARVAFYHGNISCTPLEIAREHGSKEIVKLLEEFATDKNVVMRRLKKKQGIWSIHDSAQIFTLEILCSNGYFRIKSDIEEGDKALNTQRTFKILMALPIEIQMIICNRVYDVFNTNFISSSLIELELGILRQVGFFV